VPQHSDSIGIIRVLHVDDDDNQLVITRHLLKEIDPLIEIEFATSPEEAMRLLHEQTFDCVVTDLLFPGMDGIEFARTVKETSNVPFIIYTGKQGEEAVEAAFAAGVDDYLVKELDKSHYQKLVKRIRATTERRQTEKALRECEEKLHGQENRFKELPLAEQINTAGKVVSFLAHDIRGALQTITSAIDLLKLHPEKTEEMHNVMMKSVKQVAEMLEELRNQTRVSPLNITDINLKTLIRKAVAEFAFPESIEVEENFGDDLDSVPLDLEKMRRVLNNLMKNAVESMPNGGELDISANRINSDILIVFSDTGVGIQEEQLPSLFEPFHTTKPKHLGLGLAYCKSVVEAHSGSIIVKSEVEKGTSFTIKLPVTANEDHLMQE
jgi:signal transduction histidine kinase